MKFKDTEKFYNLMQTYRHMPLTEFDEVLKSYHDVIKYVNKQINKRGQK